jgi:hypothetical protein
MTLFSPRTIIIIVTIVASCGGTAVRAQSKPDSPTAGRTVRAPLPRVPIAPGDDLFEVTLLKVASGNAIVRSGNKDLLVVRVGDRLGRNQAEIREIAAGRIVLDEAFVDADGRPHRARVTIKEGEKGGTRILLRNEEEPPATGRQRVVVPPRRGPGK